MSKLKYTGVTNEYLTNGDVVTLIEEWPEYTQPETPWFTWPATYVVEHKGKKITGHTTNFEEVKDE